MKDSNDNLTADLLPVPRPRGRPRTGTAMTNAERQAKHRAKRALQADKTVTVTVNDEFATVTVKRDELSLLLTIVQVASEASGFFGFSVDDRRALSGLEAAIGRAVYADTPLGISRGFSPTSHKGGAEACIRR